MDKNKKDELINQNHMSNAQPSKNEDFVPTLPLNPDVGVIRENLSRIPVEINYWEGVAGYEKSQIDDLKTYIKGKNKKLDIEKSRIRSEVMKKWKEDMKEFLPNVKELLKQFENDSNVNKAVMQQLIKEMKPEKPTKNDLDDYANLKTEKMQQDIYEWEKKLNEMQSNYEALKVKINLYNNTFISVRAHVRMLERDMFRPQ